MILIDFNSVATTACIKLAVQDEGQYCDFFYMCPLVLDHLRTYRMQHHHKYGEVLIAVDCYDEPSWRKTFFPHYKHSRKEKRDKSKIDWNCFYGVMRQIERFLIDHSPYKILRVPEAEADDIVAVLAEHTPEKNLVVSGDKDMHQLVRHSNVAFYNVHKGTLVDKDLFVDRLLKEHIIRGDKSDGIPNFLSPGDAFVVKQRQTPIRQKMLDIWLDLKPEEFCDNVTINYYNRNKTLIDFSEMPNSIKLDILHREKETLVESKTRRKKLLDACLEHGLTGIIKNIGDY